MNTKFSHLETKLIIRDLLETVPFATFASPYRSGAYLISNKKSFYVSFGNCDIGTANIITIFINKAPYEFYFTSEHGKAETAYFEALSIFQKIIEYYFQYQNADEDEF